MYKEVYGLKAIKKFHSHDYSSHYSDPIYEIFCYKTVKGKLVKHVENYFENRNSEYYTICPYNNVDRNMWSNDCTNGFVCDRVFDNENDCEKYCEVKNNELFRDYCYKFKDINAEERQQIMNKLNEYGDFPH